MKIKLEGDKPEYPKVMEVDYNEDFIAPLKRVVFMEKNGMYLAWAEAETLEEAEDSVDVVTWPYARVPEPKPDTWYAVAIDPPWGAKIQVNIPYQEAQNSFETSG